MYCVQYTVCIPCTVILSAIHALCSIHRLSAVQSSALCTTCIVFNTPSVCRTQYNSVHYMQSFQYTVCKPYTVLPIALHALCSMHLMYAVQNTTQCTTCILLSTPIVCLHSTTQCTTCIIFKTPSVCRTQYSPVHYMHCVQYTVCMPYTILPIALHALCSKHRIYTVHCTA